MACIHAICNVYMNVAVVYISFPVVCSFLRLYTFFFFDVYTYFYPVYNGVWHV